MTRAARAARRARTRAGADAGSGTSASGAAGDDAAGGSSGEATSGAGGSSGEATSGGSAGGGGTSASGAAGDDAAGDSSGEATSGAAGGTSGGPAAGGGATHSPAPSAGPSQTPASFVRAYYRHLDEGDFDSAWAVLSPGVRAVLGPYARWKGGYAATRSNRPVQIATTGGATTTVTHVLVARDEGCAQRRFRVTWQMRANARTWTVTGLRAVALDPRRC